VNQSLVSGAILASLILLFFLRNWRGLLVICINIPVCLIATFAMMFLVPQKLTLNVMTLSGLALGVGMLVDNSIVVLENIHQVKNKFPSMKEAAIEGTSSMTLAIVASTITTVAVFLPIVFLNNQIRMLYSGIAITVTFSLLASLFAALTLTPMIFSKFTKENVSEKIEPHYLKKMRLKYRSYLGEAIRNRKKIIILVLCIFALSVFLLAKFVEKEFIGATQQEDFTIFVELPTGAKLDISDKAVSEIEKALSGIKEIKNVTARVEPWSSKVYVKLVPLKDRRRSATEVINSLRPKVKDVENKFREAFIYFEEPEQVETNEVLIEIYGYDYQVLNKLAITLISKMETVKGLTDLKIRWRKGRPEWKIVVDKEKAAYFGLTTQEVSEILHTQTRGLRATLFHSEARQIEVIGRLQLADRQSIEQIKKLVIVLSDGRKIYLEQIANFVADTGPGKIWRRNKSRMIQVSANRGKFAFGTAVEKIKDSIKNVEFPKDYYYRFGENYQRMLENQSQLSFVLVLVLILTFLILAALFASYSQPFIIMATVPLAIIGTVFALLITRKPINVGVLMGFIILGGIVVNNAIIMVDHMNTLKARGYKLLKVIIQGAVDRLRPVLMTSTTTVLGLVPLAMDRSEESTLWSPLAITVIGGMLTSTFLTLFVVPSIYLFFEETLGRKRKNTPSRAPFDH
jgi:HAE1 family hydrophobic/amphiphilic exporter-1